MVGSTKSLGKGNYGMAKPRLGNYIQPFITARPTITVYKPTGSKMVTTTAFLLSDRHSHIHFIEMYKATGLLTVSDNYRTFGPKVAFNQPTDNIMAEFGLCLRRSRHFVIDASLCGYSQSKRR